MEPTKNIKNARHSGQTKCEPESRTKHINTAAPTLLQKRISENEKRVQWGRYNNKKTHQESELVVSIQRQLRLPFLFKYIGCIRRLLINKLAVRNARTMKYEAT